MKAHENERMYPGHEPHWETRDDGEEHCSYCGSIRSQKVMELLRTPGTSFSGSDWKYGWPHKFYLDSGGKHFKFYNTHLRDIADAPLLAFSMMSEKFFHIAWHRNEEKGLGWRAVPGIQMWGDVGADGEPDFSRMVASRGGFIQ